MGQCQVAPPSLLLIQLVKLRPMVRPRMRAEGDSRPVSTSKARRVPRGRGSVVQIMLVSGVLAATCGCGPSTATAPAPSELPDSLESLGLYEQPLVDLVPAAGVVRYEINSSSFVDYAQSDFVVKLPPGTSATYAPVGALEFPIGTILAQTLTYPDGAGTGQPRRVETRVLLRREDKWIGLPYVWDESQNEARLELVGARVNVFRRHTGGSLREQRHVVPNFNDCKRCHRIGDAVTPLATTARQLNRSSSAAPQRDNQLAFWESAGLLTGLPAADEVSRLAQWDATDSGTLSDRARAWLEANCAHCHNPQGTARNSGLYLSAAVESPTFIGVLKSPVAAGRGSVGLQFDILPGQPNASILLRRVQSTEPGIMMPEFGRTQEDEEGVALLRAWIETMPPVDMATFAAGTVGLLNELSQSDLAVWAADAIAHGDAVRGERIFVRQELNCTKCHAVRGRGANIGPDLAKLADRATPEHLVESILLPAKVVRDDYRMVTLETTSGQVMIGVLINEDPSQITLRDPYRGDTQVSKTEIVERIEGGTLMPANVVSILRREEFLDLVRYLHDLNLSPGAQPSDGLSGP